MVRQVHDSESVRRQNRGLVLNALRRLGPLARTQLAGVTGLSHASITAIVQDMIGQGVLDDIAEARPDGKARGRPATRVGFNRAIAYSCLIEIDVNRIRLSLIDYGGTLVDRTEQPLVPGEFARIPASQLLVERVGRLGDRNPAEMLRLRRIAISVQGMLDRSGAALAWSPVPGLAGQDMVRAPGERFGVPVTLIKRGRLLAEGTKRLDERLQGEDVATVFVGSTVAMGLSAADGSFTNEEGATEFGHMNHVPGGALCRCGMRGCIEAYAADYGILRTAYSVPEHTQPAPSMPPADYEQLIGRALAGERSATHAFNLAGRALGYGLARLLSIFEPAHVVIVGPGARALPLMRTEIEAAFAATLVARIKGRPEVRALRDEIEPAFQGLLQQVLADLDQSEISALPPVIGTGR